MKMENQQNEIKIFPAIKKPIKVAVTPAVNCAGIISMLGFFLTITTKTAKDIGIMKAIIFPKNSSED